MKVLQVTTGAPRSSILALIFGKEVTIEGGSLPEIAKKAMKAENYFTRDTDIMFDIGIVLGEQQVGLR